MHFYGSVSSYPFRTFPLFKNCPGLEIAQACDSKNICRITGTNFIIQPFWRNAYVCLQGLMHCLRNPHPFLSQDLSAIFLIHKHSLTHPGLKTVVIEGGWVRGWSSFLKGILWGFEGFFKGIASFLESSWRESYVYVWRRFKGNCWFVGGYLKGIRCVFECILKGIQISPSPSTGAKIDLEMKIPRTPMDSQGFRKWSLQDP